MRCPTCGSKECCGGDYAQEADALRARVAELERERDDARRQSEAEAIAYSALSAEADRLRTSVAELEPMAECAAIMAVCGYFSRMRQWGGL